MRRVYTIIFIGCISCAGFAVHAQSGGDSGSSLLSDSDSASRAIEDMLNEADMSQGPREQQKSAIDDDELLVTEVENPEEDLVRAEAIDSKTKRYPPRLKIDFAEFPLFSLTTTKKRDTKSLSRADIVAQRIQRRLRVPKINLVVEDRVATISGTVPTERQRNIAESMLRFEPGIDAVQNELTVVSEP
jgi:hypothetical protein